MSHLVSAAELTDLIDAGVRVLDVRFRLEKPDGLDDYREGHIPGAVYVDLEHELSAHGRPEDGRHPLPSTATVQAAARRWGLNDGDIVVVYDDYRGVAAARAWWILRHGGVDVRVLDGGWGAWKDAGGATESGSTEYAPGTVTLTDVSNDSLTIDEAAEFPASGVLLDARAPERFRGESEPLDPIAGHIPGAVNLPTGKHLAAGGAVLDLETLQKNFAGAGISEDTPVAVYCGSGLTAAHSALILTEVGIDAKVFHGSWSQWSNTPGRPVTTGE